MPERTIETIQQNYDHWASTYDKDMASWSYKPPEELAKRQHLKTRS